MNKLLESQAVANILCFNHIFLEKIVASWKLGGLDRITMASCKLTVCVLNLDHVITGLPDASSRKPFTTVVSRKQSYSVVNTL